jgi:hypothetical protein
MLRNPSIIEQPTDCARKAARAKWWRINTVKLSRAQLSERTGYSIETIGFFERGYNDSGRAIGDKEWRRYRMACAAVQCGCDDFDWHGPRREILSAERDMLESRPGAAEIRT